MVLAKINSRDSGCDWLMTLCIHRRLSAVCGCELLILIHFFNLLSLSSSFTVCYVLGAEAGGEALSRQTELLQLFHRRD